MLTKYHTREMATATERHLRNTLKFRTAGEVNSKEGVALTEGLLLPPPNRSEVETPQVKLNRAVGEAFMTHNPHQCLRTKLIFDIKIDDPFLD